MEKVAMRMPILSLHGQLHISLAYVILATRFHTIMALISQLYNYDYVYPNKIMSAINATYFKSEKTVDFAIHAQKLYSPINLLPSSLEPRLANWILRIACPCHISSITNMKENTAKKAIIP